MSICTVAYICKSAHILSSPPHRQISPLLYLPEALHRTGFHAEAA